MIRLMNDGSIGAHSSVKRHNEGCPSGGLFCTFEMHKRSSEADFFPPGWTALLNVLYSSDFEQLIARSFLGGDTHNYYYYRYSALGPVWAETRAQSGDWYGSGTLHPGQVLRGSLPLLSPAF